MLINYLVNLKKLSTACLDGTLFNVDPWGQYARDFLRLAGHEQYTVRVDNGLSVFLRPNTSDKWVVQETLLQDDYRLRAMDLRQATVVDLGANIGVVSMSAAAQGAARIYAFEPAPANYDLLVKNVALNRLESVVQTFNMACAESSGTVDFYLNSDNPSGHSMYGTSGSKIAVRSTTVPDIFATHGIDRCDLLKIDVEGAEFAILYGIPPELFPRIARIYLECHPTNAPRHTSADLTSFLRSQGYVVEEAKSVDWRISRLYCERR